MLLAVKGISEENLLDSKLKLLLKFLKGTAIILIIGTVPDTSLAFHFLLELVFTRAAISFILLEGKHFPRL